MSGSLVATARLRELSVDARARKIFTVYRRTGSLERAAAELGIPARTLSRMIAEDAALTQRLADYRTSGLRTTQKGRS